MKYFEVLQDTRRGYNYEIQNIEVQQGEIENFEVGYFKGEEAQLPDFILYKKSFIVSAALKDVIAMYTDDVQFSLVVLNNISEQLQKEYYKMTVAALDILDTKTVYFKDGSVAHKVFNSRKIGEYKVFQLKVEKATVFTPVHLFADLDIVESIIRRRLSGMCFEEVKVEES